MTPEELAQRKRISDRAVLLEHVDHVIRPPAWVYKEIEEAIRHAIAGDSTAKVKSRDGTDYVVADLIERWEIDDEILETYARPPHDPVYHDERPAETRETPGFWGQLGSHPQNS